jgi:hypothetical protein
MATAAGALVMFACLAIASVFLDAILHQAVLPALADTGAPVLRP